MPEPVSTLGLYVGYLALNSIAFRSSAVSAEALILRDSVCEVVKTTERSIALFGEKETALSRLLELADECGESNWDGYGAAAIDEASVARAANFIRALPAGIPMPEFAAEPDGAISLDWVASRTCIFSVSIGRNERIGFAWLDGTDRGHAVAHFSGNRIPQRVLDGISAILPQENAVLWAA